MDTHAFLWWGEDDPRLSDLAREVFSDAGNLVFFSVASAWEIAIKASIGKMNNVPVDLERFLLDELRKSGFELLPIGVAHVAAVRNLPFRPDHNDPFDRLLIAQAMAEGLPILSTDGRFAEYPVTVLW